MFIEFNPNPKKQYVGDCVIRAISLATDLDWNTIYISLCVWGYAMADLPSSNQVWGKYLLEHDFKKYPCPECPTVEKMHQLRNEVPKEMQYEFDKFIQRVEEM